MADRKDSCLCDDILLRQGLELEEEEIQTLKNISNKLKSRRLKRKGKV